MSDLLKNFPDPQDIRESLGANVREARILRQLVRVAELVKAERLARGRTPRPHPVLSQARSAGTR